MHSIPTIFLWSKPAKKRSSRVSQTAGIVDPEEVDMEVHMEVDGSTTSRRSCADSASSEVADVVLILGKAPTLKTTSRP